MKTTLLSLFLVAFAATAAFAQGPGGGDQPGGSSGTFTYDAFVSITTNENCLIREGTLYGYTSSLTTTVKPTTSAVTALADGIFAGNTAITTVNLANTSITEVPDSAFAGCTALKTVTLPTSCTTVGANAFAGCTALSTFTGTKVDTVGADAFRGCTALASATLPAAVGAYAYAQSGLTSVDLSTATASEGAFAGCASLTAADNLPLTLPAALFSGCTALDISDWSGVTSFGQASLAGIPATTLTFASGATLGSYALAADAATVVTTLTEDRVPTHDATSFLGREASYTVSDGVYARIEAEALVNWLAEESADAASTVEQPASYATADLETWLATQSNADSILLFGYEDEYDADATYLPLDISGTNVLWTAQDAATAESVTIALEGSYSLGDDADWSSDNLVYDADTDSYVAADPDADTLFARLRLTKGW